MANESRVRKDLKSGTLAAQLAIAATTVDLGANGAGLPTIGVAAHMAIVIDQEIVYITAHTSGVNTATIVRARETTTDALHLISAPWKHTITKRDISAGRLKAASRTAGDLALGSTSWTNLGTAPEYDCLIPWCFEGDIIEVGLDGEISDTAANELFMDAITVDNVGTPVNSIGLTPYEGTAVAAPTSTTGDGIPSWHVASGVRSTPGQSRLYRVGAADIHTSTQVTVRPRYRTAAASPTRTFEAGSASTGRFGQFWVRNHGPRESTL